MACCTPTVLISPLAESHGNVRSPERPPWQNEETLSCVGEAAICDAKVALYIGKVALSQYKSGTLRWLSGTFAGQWQHSLVCHL